MDYNLFSVFPNPILILSEDGRCVFANPEFYSFFAVKAEDLKEKVAFDVVRFTPSLDFIFRTSLENMPVKNVEFRSTNRAGSVPFTARKLNADNPKANSHIVIVFTPATENLVDRENALTAQALLALAENETRRLDWQMKFLLRFNADTKFIADIETIALKFMEQACLDLGFLGALCFSFSPDQKSCRLINFYSLAGKLKAAPEIVPDEAFVPTATSSIFQLTEGIRVLTHDELAQMNTLPVYQAFGIQHVDNAIVLTIRRSSQILAQFHLINHSLTNKISTEISKLLEYMVDPLALTFENVDLYLSSITDELTKVYNVRYFKMRFRTELHQAKRNGRPLALLLIDIDNLKAIKDTHGHQISDQVITTVAQALRTSVRGFDITARYGGEEFVMLLLETDRKAALAACDRIRQQTSKLIFRTNEDEAFKVTLSIGLALSETDGTEVEQLLKSVDVALRKEKQGR